MGVCRFLFKSVSYSFVAFSGILAYFHFTQCLNEKTRPDFDPFDPKLTDAHTELGFAKKGGPELYEYKAGLFYALFSQWCPCALRKLGEFLQAEDPHKNDNETHKLIIHDARKAKKSFKEAGFTLIEFEKESETVDFRTPLQNDPNADIQKFQKELEPHIKSTSQKLARVFLTIFLIFRALSKR